MDELTKGKYLDAYGLIHVAFFSAFTKEEKYLSPKKGDSLLSTHTLRKNWATDRVWYLHALDNPRVLCNLFFQHIQPMFAQSLDDASMTAFKSTLTPF